MRRSFIIAAAMTAGAATPALATDGTVTVNGNVAPKCLFTTPSDTIFIPEMSGNDGKLDPATVNGQSAQLVGWCNSTAAVMFVNATPLENIGTPGPNYDNRVDYTATANANSVNADDTSLTPTPGSEANVGLFVGDVIVTLSASSSPGSKLLLSGEYNGTVTVTLAPAAAPGEVND
jgi:hypothetical protein